MEKYAQQLLKEVETSLDSYIERMKAIKWFSPKNLNRDEIDKSVNFAIEGFGLKASIEYRQLKTTSDWDAARGAARDAAQDAAWGAARDAARDAAWGAARDAAWGAAWDAAWGAAWDAARDAAQDAAWGAAWDAARDAAQDAAWGAARDAARGAVWDAAWGAADLLALHLPEYKEKYPNGNFINLIPLYEVGLYPVGIVDGKMIVYIPCTEEDIPEGFNL